MAYLENLMKTIYIVIIDCGDGSNTVEWHKTWSNEKQEKLENKERYQSGDGLQLRELHFPDTFDIGAFTKDNHIYWYEEDQDDDE